MRYEQAYLCRVDSAYFIKYSLQNGATKTNIKKRDFNYIRRLSPEQAIIDNGGYWINYYYQQSITVINVPMNYHKQFWSYAFIKQTVDGRKLRNTVVLNELPLFIYRVNNSN